MDKDEELQKLLEENKKLKEQLENSKDNKKEKKKEKKALKKELKKKKKEEKTEKKKPRKLKKKVVVILILLLVFLLVGGGLAVYFIFFHSNFKIDEFKKNVVLIIAYDENDKPVSTGSGVYINNNTIYTNAHVVVDAKKLEVVLDDNVKVELKGIQSINEDKDIAILVTEKVDGIKTLKTKTKVKVGEEVYAVGSPLGLKNTVSDGVISSEYEEKTLKEDVYQHTAPISPGSSGGALINKKGELLGINFASYEDGQNLNLAIKIDAFNEEYEDTKNDELIEVETSSFFEVKELKNPPGKEIYKYVCSVNLNCYASTFEPKDMQTFKADIDTAIQIGSSIYIYDETTEDDWLYIYILKMKKRTDENDANFKKFVDEEALETRDTYYSLDIKHYWGINNNYYYYVEYGEGVDITDVVKALKELTGGSYE